MTRVLIVDDSALMRRHLKAVLEAAGTFEVVAARNGREALALAEEINPDVITLDVNMPEMDGLTCLANLMATHPRPVVMVSSLTEKGAEVTFEALALGAVDFIHKPEGTISINVGRIEEEIVAKVAAAAQARVRRATGLAGRVRAQRAVGAARVTPAAPPSLPTLAAHAQGVVLVGVSTGGPGTLEDILPGLGRGFPWPVVVAQHMPGSFTSVFARRLDGLCPLNVVEAAGLMPLEAGSVYIAKGDADVVISARAGRLVVQPVPASASHLWHPSVTRLVESALHVVAPENLIGVLLTGMGNDGAAAMTELRRRGGRTVAQDEASCVIYGMPGDLVQRGGASVILPAGRIAAQLTDWLAIGKETRHGSRQG
ncbi:chemotaxis-specific protein-glutamate methyltransferase CheB [Pararhodospirillum oryzae]|uniref:Protein-glutamate methylesterase/protein-glutamine glutaminase n=1 Tax=Pararhodospirillum oryzae TaxID=478448 RepID=A0A512H7C5_9PROT|nr:chemotaxis-specific protein-glutamate methyltransferase CheB [Pararhodospirillum oryzae]GEO81341.1 chemotaxis response regulator protein-glutamate methylesterase 3 [Pararhodospirillum oryzae]